MTDKQKRAAAEIRNACARQRDNQRSGACGAIKGTRAAYLMIDDTELIEQLTYTLEADGKCKYVVRVDESAYKHLECDKCGNEEDHPKKFCPGCGREIEATE